MPRYFFNNLKIKKNKIEHMENDLKYQLLIFIFHIFVVSLPLNHSGLNFSRLLYFLFFSDATFKLNQL